jgi:outer membrane lipoprotein-sorting protein
MSRLLPSFVGVLLFAAGLASSASAAPLELGQLMDALAASPHGTATFTEKKYISFLEQPVESSGTLRFVAPARLEKNTLKPTAESLVLDGEVLTVERGKRKQVLQLKDYPEVAGMIESIRATLAGDRRALERVYQLSLKGTTARWTLELVPLDARVARMVTRIQMEGAQAEVRTVEIQQADGDYSVMSIQAAAP